MNWKNLLVVVVFCMFIFGMIFLSISKIKDVKPIPESEDVSQISCAGGTKSTVVCTNKLLSDLIQQLKKTPECPAK